MPACRNVYTSVTIANGNLIQYSFFHARAKKKYFVTINDLYKGLRSNEQGHKQHEQSYEKTKNKDNQYKENYKKESPGHILLKQVKG